MDFFLEIHFKKETLGLSLQGIVNVCISCICVSICLRSLEKNKQKIPTNGALVILKIEKQKLKQNQVLKIQQELSPQVTRATPGMAEPEGFDSLIVLQEIGDIALGW